LSVESALIAQAQPYMVAASAREIIRNEIRKGCTPEISLSPVSLEPPYIPLWAIKDHLTGCDQLTYTPETPASHKNLKRLQVWISPDQKFDWNLSELFIKHLQILKYRVAFELSGNNENVSISFLVHQQDLPIIMAAFQGEYDLCELTPMTFSPLSKLTATKWIDIKFRDYSPPPPYSHLLTRPQEFQISPLRSLITVLSNIKAPATGFYQAVFQPVPPVHNWHRNVKMLLDFEYNIKLQDGFHAPQRYAQQSPSGDLKQMAWEVENKAHNDKPLYFTAFRLGVINAGNQAEILLDALSTLAALYQHGGRPLSYQCEKDYAKILPRKHFTELFASGLTYRPGFLVNSLELTGMVHVPPASISENSHVKIDVLETLPVENPELSSGTWIGTCNYAGNEDRVCLPDGPRNKHTHLIGRSGVGKSTTQEHMVLSDIEHGHGVAVLDPHGDLVERLLCLIPERHISRTIYFDPGDPDWIPIWNPLQRIPGQDIGRTADDIVQAIQSFIARTGWGDRLEHLLRNMIFSLIHLPHGTFLDISNLLRNKSDEANILKREILKVVDNETVHQFWRHDYEKYGKDDFGPPRNKLSKLLVSNTVSLMLSQPESLFNFRDIMDQGMILLVNLSNIGSMVRGILGCFILSLLHLSALSRNRIPADQRKQFHIHCDEAHRFMTDSLEDLIAETRKFKVSLSLAHQYMSQFGKRKTDAFSSVGSTIIFNVDNRDAGYLIKDLQKKVKVEDIVSLGVGDAIARIGSDIVRFRTKPPLSISQKNFRNQIIEASHRKYCRPAHEVRKMIRRRGDRWCMPFSPLVTASAQAGNGRIEEFVYDEF
jgi:Type IV secretion-system coupling protein DNA-binding domain